MSEWREIKGKLPCGCYARADIRTEDDVSDEVALLRAGAMYACIDGTIPHNRDHREICIEALKKKVGDEIFYLHDFKINVGNF